VFEVPTKIEAAREKPPSALRSGLSVSSDKKNRLCKIRADAKRAVLSSCMT
jgi:hypothetical protein